MLEKVRQTIEKYKMLNSGEKVLVGVSGGPDSLALLHVLWRLKGEFGILLHVVHVDHMLRGEESAEDARTVVRFASQLGLPVTVRAVDVASYQREKGISTEMAAREMRYKVYWETQKEVGAKKIAVGHNLNDQAETVIMRFLRGSGGTGLAGIYPIRENGLIRPLLEVDRSEIEAYCQAERLPVRRDPSNAEPVYLRNRLRLELLPHLKKEYNPQIFKTLSQTASIFRDEEEVWETIVRQAWRQCAVREGKGKLVFSLTEFLGLKRAVQRRLLREMFGRLTGLWGISFTHLEEIIDFAAKGCTGGFLCLPKGVRVEKGYEMMTISTEEQHVNPSKSYAYTLPVPGTVYIPEARMWLHADFCENALEKHNEHTQAYLDFGLVELPLIVRSRRSGDRFHPLGAGGTRKLKDYFIDRKIPRNQRDFWPLVTDQAGIIWVVGERLDERVKITEKTQKILRIAVEKTEQGEEKDDGK